MSKKIALCRVSDTEPLLSLVRMLEYAGYECVLPDRDLRDYLRSIGCTNVDEPSDMCERWGAEPLVNKSMTYPLGFSYQDLIAGLDLYVDVNAFHNGPLLWKQPRFEWLQKKTLCYFINGGPPRNTADKGDGITPACPVITTNQWYKENISQCRVKNNFTREVTWSKTQHSWEWPWRDKSYVFYPSFERWDHVLPRTPDLGGSPVCFCHNVMGWYDQFSVEAARKLGCKFYGGGSSPDGLVRHEDVFSVLAKAPCVVYLKSGGAVDYAVLEAMASGVPVVVPTKYVEDTLTRPLMEETWMVDEGNLIVELEASISLLRDPIRNFAVGNWGRERVKELCWREDRDGPGFKGFLERMGF